jgi:hypothetical protein
MNRIQVGLLTIFISGVLFTIGYALAGPFVQALSQVNQFATGLGSVGFRLGILINLIGIVLQIFGFLALYAVLQQPAPNRLSLLALVLSLAGLGLTLPPTGVLPFALAQLASSGALAPDTSFALVRSIFNDPVFTAMLAISGLSVTVGAILFSIGLFRQKRVPILAAVIFGLANFFLNFAPVIPVTAFVLPIDLAGAVLLAIAGAWFAKRLWMTPEQMA